MPLLSPPRRQRLLQTGFAIAALAAVAIADRIASLLGATRTAEASPEATPEAVLVALSGRVLGGWALGVAFRLQFTRSTRPDVRLRWMLALPAGVIAAWPLVAVELPSAVRTTLPAWLLTEAASLAGFAAAAVGLALSLSVVPGRGRG